MAHPQRKGESRGEGGTVRALALASTALCLGLHALGVEGCGPLTEQHISRLLPQGSTQIPPSVSSYPGTAPHNQN